MITKGRLAAIETMKREFEEESKLPREKRSTVIGDDITFTAAVAIQNAFDIVIDTLLVDNPKESVHRSKTWRLFGNPTHSGISIVCGRSKDGEIVSCGHINTPWGEIIPSRFVSYVDISQRVFTLLGLKYEEHSKDENGYMTVNVTECNGVKLPKVVPSEQIVTKCLEWSGLLEKDWKERLETISS